MLKLVECLKLRNISLDVCVSVCKTICQTFLENKFCKKKNIPDFFCDKNWWAGVGICGLGGVEVVGRGLKIIKKFKKIKKIKIKKNLLKM